MQNRIAVVLVLLIIAVGVYFGLKMRNQGGDAEGGASDEVIVDFAARRALPALVNSAVQSCKAGDQNGPLDAVISFDTAASGIVVRSVSPHPGDGGLSAEARDCVAQEMRDKLYSGSVDGGLPAGRTYELDGEFPFLRSIKLN